jgi:hypothetical protein
MRPTNFVSYYFFLFILAFTGCVSLVPTSLTLLPCLILPHIILVKSLLLAKIQMNSVSVVRITELCIFLFVQIINYYLEINNII